MHALIGTSWALPVSNGICGAYSNVLSMSSSQPLFSVVPSQAFAVGVRVLCVSPKWSISCGWSGARNLLCSMSMFAFRSVAVFTLCADAVRIPTLTPYLFSNTSSHERIVEPRSLRVHGHCVARKPFSFSRVALVCGVAGRVHLVQQGWCELLYRKSQPAHSTVL